MRFRWRNYDSSDAGLVDSWLDGDAVRQTGLDDGWQSFYDYWMAQSRAGEGKDRCFLLWQGNMPFAVMYLCVLGGEMILSELVVAPGMRGRGYGTAVIMELLENAVMLVGTPVCAVKAAIFPGNLASVRAFEKAGFSLVSRQRDAWGDSLHYAYRFDSDPER